MRHEDLGFTLTALVQSAHSALDGEAHSMMLVAVGCPRSTAESPCAAQPSREVFVQSRAATVKHVSQSQTSKYKKIPRALARLGSGVTQPRP